LQIQEGNRNLPVLDLGCGRGEFLSLLWERGDRVIGVDLNATSVRRLQEQGYDAHHADGAEYLLNLPDSSLAGITAFQVIEHLSFGYLQRLIKVAHAKLAPGGMILIETVNPDCLELYRSFYLDPTHENPIPRDLLAVLLRFYGFRNLEVFYQDPLPPSEIRTGQDWSRSYSTYAILGWK
jgi:O-antigen chain-terminating methyltransferase